MFLAFASLSNAQWVQLSGTSNWLVNDIVVTGNYIFTGTESGFIYRSTNNGNSWDTVFNTNGLRIWNFAISGNYIFAGCDAHTNPMWANIFRSTDNGTSWNLSSSGIPGGDISVKVYGNNLYAVANRTGIYLSTNNGSSWSTVWFSSLQLHLFDLAISGPNMLVGGYQLYLSSNNGVSWDTIKTGGLPSNLNSINCLEINGNNVYLGAYPGGLYKSTNNGYNWNNILSIPDVETISFYGNNIFAGGYGFYISSNSGVNWISKFDGLSNDSLIWTFANNNSYAFIGVRGYDTAFRPSGIWRRPFSEVIGIQNISTEIPSAFSLSQNYPNPFNPTTNIRFDLLKSGIVKLVVFDALGREVATLVNESLSPGTYEVTFDASKLNSGVYFYKITSGDFSDVKKMLLIK